MVEARTDSVMTAARNGERWAENALHDLIRSFARYVCDRGAAGDLPELDWEDVAQEASRRLFTVGLQRFRSGGSERSYVFTYVKTTYLQMSRGAWRRIRREQANVAGEESGASGASGEDPEVRTHVHGILSRLSETCRDLLSRLFFDGAMYADLAGELGLAESSVRARASRCMAKARELAA